MDGLSTPLYFRRRDPLLALVTDAVHRLDRQVFEITVTLRLHPQSGRYADPGVGQTECYGYSDYLPVHCIRDERQ